MFVPDRRHIYAPPQMVACIAFIFHGEGVHTSQETNLWASTTCYLFISRLCSYLTWNTPMDLHGLIRGVFFLKDLHDKPGPFRDIILGFSEGTRKRRCLRREAARRKVAGSSPNAVTEYIFNWPNPSGRTTVLGFTQPVIKMSTGD
jgi:hypothetical protein